MTKKETIDFAVENYSNLIGPTPISSKEFGDRIREVIGRGSWRARVIVDTIKGTHGTYSAAKGFVPANKE